MDDLSVSVVVLGESKAARLAHEDHVVGCLPLIIGHPICRQQCFERRSRGASHGSIP